MNIPDKDKRGNHFSNADKDKLRKLSNSERARVIDGRKSIKDVKR